MAGLTPSSKHRRGGPSPVTAILLSDLWNLEVDAHCPIRLLSRSNINFPERNIAPLRIQNIERCRRQRIVLDLDRSPVIQHNRCHPLSVGHGCWQHRRSGRWFVLFAIDWLFLFRRRIVTLWRRIGTLI